MNKIVGPYQSYKLLQIPESSWLLFSTFSSSRRHCNWHLFETL